MPSHRPAQTPANTPPPRVDRPAPQRPRGRPPGARTRLLNSGAGPIGRHHFAFLRALLDGIPLEQAWRTYLSFSGGPGDRRQAVGQLRQLVDTLGRAGGHQGCAPAMAVALPALRALPDLARRQAKAKAGAGAGNPGQSTAAPGLPQPPTLDDWRARQCGSAGIDEDFYTETEWLALYADAVGCAAATSAGAGNPGQPMAAPSPALSATSHVRLAEASVDPALARQAPAQRRALLDALVTLEQALAREPRLGDATGLWLAGRLPPLLATVGVRTLGDLVNLVNLNGFRWHRRVTGLGVVRAQRLLEWLLPLAAAGGQPVLETSRRPETDLVLARQRTLAAAQPAPSAAAADADDTLVGDWLDRHSGATRRAYARVTDRFLRWARVLRHQPLAALTADDLLAYLDFVQAPPADWVQQRRVRRDSPAWRPFQGPLGPSSRRHELAVLASLLTDLHAAGQLPRNPAARLLRRLDLPAPTVDVGRSLSPAQWHFALRLLHEKPDTPARRRLQLLLALAGGAGLRLSELATTRLHALRRAAVDGQPAWLLDVVGRAGRTRTVLIPDEVRALVAQHHRDMDAAGLGLDTAASGVQAPCPAPPHADRGGGTHPGWPDEAQTLRPLVGILRRPPPRRTLDALGLPLVDRQQRRPADSHGALERSAIDKLLRRFFHGVAREAAARSGAPDADAFLAASSHWLRHSFAHRAAQQLSQPLLQQVLGHVSPRATARYLASDTAAVVRGMRALQPLDGAPDMP